MIQKVLAFVEQHHMLQQGDHILAGVSGGADSVCLLMVLCELRRQWDCRISVVHVEHGIRGEASMQDARFVEELCSRLQVECRIIRCDAVTFSRENNMSLEEGARELRYRYFTETAREWGADKIAVAHNQNDCAETLLFHLARGTGIKGMCGIRPVREEIIRPLLCVNREEIETYLKEIGQPFCQDATNQETEYSRNKIRHQVLPVLKAVNEGAVAHLYRSTEYIAEAVELVDELVNRAWEKYVTEEEAGDEISVQEAVKEESLLVQKTLVLEMLGKCAGSRKDIGDVHVSQTLELLKGHVGRRISLPYGMVAVRTYEGVRLQKDRVFDGSRNQCRRTEGRKLEEQENWVNQQVIPGTELEIAAYGWKISARILEKNGEFHEIPQKTYTKWFDYDKISGTLLLRKRCTGDFFVLDDSGRKQSLKKYFINEKIPVEKRDRIPILAEGAHILWAMGYRISEAYKIKEDTKRVLEIQVNGGNIHE